MIEKVKVPDKIRKEYEEKLFEKNIDFVLLNQLLKMLDFGCIVLYDKNLNTEILRNFKKAYSPATWFLNGINLFNMYYNKIETKDSYLLYYASGETKFLPNNVYLKVVKIQLAETVIKKDEEKYYEDFLKAKNDYAILSAFQKLRYNSLFRKYFGTISKDFSLKITQKELEQIEYLSIKYLRERYKHHFFSPQEGLEEAKVNRILEDLDNKKDLEDWEIFFLEKILYATKDLK